MNISIKPVWFLLALSFISLFYIQNGFSQCSPNTPTFIVNLAATNTKTWISSDTARSDTCCGSTAPDKCVKFIVTLPLGAMGIVFDIYSGAIPPGALYYQIACGPSVAVGANICLNSQGPHVITFCKPGNNKNQYSISAYPYPDISDAITVNEGCNGIIRCYDYSIPTIRWNSIYPGSYGAYNSYLSCSTACDSTKVTAQPGYPPYVDYMVCGQPIGGCTTDTFCDTVRVFFKSTLKAIIQPDSPTICYGAVNTTLQASGSGGSPPYRYVWSTLDTTTSLNVDTGIYILTVYDTSQCPPAYDTVEVTAFSSTITANAGPDLLSCDTFVNISGSITAAGGGKWVGGNGVFTPSRVAMNVTYYPTKAEQIAGLVNLKLITTGNGTCPADTDDLKVRFRKFTDTIRSVITHVSCYGGTNGSILLQPSGQTAPYTYLWSTSATGVGINNIDTGRYIVTVTDSGGCKWKDTFMITQPTVLAATSTNKMVNCFGGNDGEINLTVSGAVAPYSYIWSNSSTTQDLTGITAGIYMVTVTDSHGCVLKDTFTISQPSKLILSHAITHVNCYGNASGAIDLTISGGVLPYNYTWSNSSTTQDISGLTADTYTVVVADSHGCAIRDTVYLTQPTKLIKSHAITSLKCYGDNNGIIDLSISGGVMPYSYSWSNSSTTQDLNGLAAGTYIVTVTDSHGCVIRDTAVITQPPQITKNLFLTNVSCFGGNNGDIDLSVNGGVKPYTYSWSNSATTQDLKLVKAGIYTVIITDSNLCTKYDTAVITQPSALSLTAIVKNVSCFKGNNGSVTVSVSGGTPPYKYLWSNNDTNASPANLKKGQYILRTTDYNGCVRRDTFNITEPLALTLTGTVKNVCKVSNNGAVDITPTGGKKPYSYIWSNSAVTQDLNNIPRGQYIVTVTDSNGCKLMDTFVVREALIPLAIGLFPTHVKCFGESNGSINAQTIGGEPYLSLRWSNGDTTYNITGLKAGNYKLVITDALGCKDSASTLIQQPLQLNQTAVVTNVSCSGKKDGSIILSVSGGTKPYKCNWSDGDTGLSIRNKSAGSYNAVISDIRGCTLTYNGIIKQPPLLIYSYQIKNVSCSGGKDGAITSFVSGGTPLIRFLWSTGDTNRTINNLNAGRYLLTITEGNGCRTVDSIFISQPSPLQIQYTKTDEKCRGDQDGSINITVSGGTLPYSYKWNNLKYTEDIHNLPEGNYYVTVTDSHSCILTSDPIHISAFSLPTPTIEPGNNFMACIDELINITVVEDFASYLWNTGETGKSINVTTKGYFYAHVTDFNGCKGVTKSLRIDRLDPSLFASLDDEYHFCKDNGPVTITAGSPSYGHYLWMPTGETTRSITVDEEGMYILTYDTMGCFFTDTTYVREVCPPIVFIPNVITPNDNGLNEFFKISALYVDELKYVIFDRWGTIIFRGNSADDVWDGTYNGQLVMMDAYGYVVFYRSKAYGEKVLSGTVTVLY